MSEALGSIGLFLCLPSDLEVREPHWILPNRDMAPHPPGVRGKRNAPHATPIRPVRRRWTHYGPFPRGHGDESRRTGINIQGCGLFWSVPRGRNAQWDGNPRLRKKLKTCLPPGPLFEHRPSVGSTWRTACRHAGIVVAGSQRRKRVAPPAGRH